VSGNGRSPAGGGERANGGGAEATTAGAAPGGPGDPATGSQDPAATAVASPIDRAFDDRRPPQIELIEDCVHCGFCLPTCPTYVLWHEEMDSPRGRIVLMKSGLEEGSELSPTMVRHFDNCLGCMACVTACPSGVRYDKLIEDTRQQVERHHERDPSDRGLRRLLFETFPRPGRLRALAPGLILYRRLGLDRLVERSGLLERFPRLRALENLAPAASAADVLRPLPTFVPARGERRGTVGLLQGCVQRVFFRRVNAATALVLSAEGYDVAIPRAPRCCGALMYHTGGREAETAALARETIATFEDCDHLVVNAAGCGSAIKHYDHQLRDDPEWRERAGELAGRTRDLSELLADIEPRAERGPLPLRVAYHDACHLAHAQGVRAQPRELLRAIPELDLVEPADWEICCGSAGVYNLVNPEAGRALGARKAANLLATEADAVASGNPGCSLQIRAHLEEACRPLPLYHPAELLWASISGRPLAGAP
jgi:glycolate oxidase iron-sulfur subunit